MLTIRIWVYREELKEKIVEVNEDNHFLIRFGLETELRNIRKNLIDYKEKKIISSNSRNPKVLNRDYKLIIQEIVFSRKSIYQSLKLIKNRKP